MFPVAVDLRTLFKSAVTAGAALLVLAASHQPSKAQTSHMIVIPASDGYGFDDCLAGNKPCGHTIADAWCEAHGMSSASSFGRSDDVTASIKAAPNSLPHVQPGAYIVNCKE